MTTRARALAILLGLGTVVALAVLLLRPVPQPDSVSDFQPTVAGLAEIEQQRTARMSEEVATAFPDAPAAVLDVARTIVAGDTPTAKALAALGVEKLNQSWSRAYADMLPEHGHTLLRQAVNSRNVAAAAALIAAGADAGYNENEMPFAAVGMEDRVDRMYWFPDYRRGNALLALWTDAGGDVNTAVYPGNSLGTLIAATTGTNLEAILMLLKAGADPWLTVEMKFSEGEGGYVSDSFAQKHANASASSSEVAFRVARLGYYRNGPPDQIADVMFMYDRTAKQYIGSSGPENLHTVWCMQKVLPLILEQTGQTATPAIAELLAMKIPDNIGGFFLGPDETRSAPIADQEVRNDNQTGTKKWND